MSSPPARHLSLVKSHFKDSPEVTAIIRPQHLTHHTTPHHPQEPSIWFTWHFHLGPPPPSELLIWASAAGEVLTAAAAQIVYLQTFPVLGFFNQLLQFKLRGGDTSVAQGGFTAGRSGVAAPSV